MPIAFPPSDADGFPQPPRHASVETWAQFIDQVASRVLPKLQKPSQTTAVLVGLALNALRQVPHSVITPTRLQALIALADYNYLSGGPMLAVEPAVEALTFARKFGDKLWLTRALNTLGNALGDTVDIAGAIGYFREGLELSRDLSNRKAESSLWNNLGTALLMAAQHDDAVRCFNRALTISGTDPDLLQRRIAAYGNIALACLQQGDIAQGLRAVKESVALLANPTDPNGLVNRTLAEVYYCRLLLDVPDFELARIRLALAKTYAERSESPRARLAALVCESLYDCATGRGDVGLTRLLDKLTEARALRTEYRDVLYAIVTACGYLGDTIRAEPYARELVLHQRSVQRDYLADLPPLAWDDGPRGSFAHHTLPNGRIRLLDEDTDHWRRITQLADAAVLRMDSTCEHGLRVGNFAARMAQAHGLAPEVCRAIECAGRVHDIGLGVLPSNLFGATADAATTQRNRLHAHTEHGEELLSGVPLELARFCAEVARNHHERYDGRGYPVGAHGGDVSLAARLIGIANELDMLLHGSPRRQKRSFDDAIAAIQRERHRKFDPLVVDLCVRVATRIHHEAPDWDDALATEAQDAHQAPLIAARKRIHALLNAPDVPSEQPV